jgi:hypothetical protein
MPTPAWRRTPEGVDLFIRVRPNGSRAGVLGVREMADGRSVLEVRVAVPAEGGRANAAAARVLAEALGVAMSRVVIVSGLTQPLKRVRIEAEGAIEERLSQLSGARHGG